MVSRLKQLWHGEHNLQSATWLLVVTMFLSNVLGFLRDVILANSLPLGTLDTYYAAFRIPDFIFNLFILGAISSAFIPVFLDIKTNKGEKAAWRLTHNLMTVALVVLVCFAILLVTFMPVLLPHFVPGFAPAKVQQTVPLARILLLSPFLFAVSYIVGGVLNAYKKFFAYSIAPLIYNTSIIVGGILSAWFGVRGVAWAVVVGAGLHLLIQVPSIRALGFRYRPVFDLRDPALCRVIRLMIPRAISLGMTQIVLLFFVRIGSYLPSGAVSIFTLTNNIQTAPVAIFAASIATAVFPMLGTAKSEKNVEQFRHLLTESLRGMLFYMIPAAVILWVTKDYIMRLYLSLNHQSFQDTLRAIHTFQWFTLALVTQGFIIIIVRAFYAQHDTRRPMYISLFSGLVSIVLAWFFATWYRDVQGLSLGFALGTLVEAALLLVVFQAAHARLLDLKRLGQTISVSLLFSLVTGVIAYATLLVVSRASSPMEAIAAAPLPRLFVALLAAVGLGLGGYLLLGHVFERTELQWLLPKRAAQMPLPSSEAVAEEEGLI